MKIGLIAFNQTGVFILTSSIYKVSIILNNDSKTILIKVSYVIKYNTTFKRVPTSNSVVSLSSIVSQNI